MVSEYVVHEYVSLTSSGLTLCKNIEQGLDKGVIVLVPEIDEKTKETKWKVVLVQKWWKNQTMMGSDKWEVSRDHLIQLEKMLTQA
jgi:hypothetical protein